MCISIYEEYNVDVNRLTRDYQQFPLKKIPRKHGGLQYEDFPKEDFIYLYIECNLPSKVLQQYLNVCGWYITKLGNLYNIKKSPEQIFEIVKKTTYEKYGVESYTQTDEYKEKSKQTYLQKYGVENYAQTDEFKEKYKQTCLEHFGVENPSQTDECKEKVKQTNLQKFGTEYYTQTNEYKERYKQTCLQNHGVENYFQSKEFKEKSKQTNLQKRGVEYHTQTDEWKEKVKQTNLQNLGVEYPGQSPIVQEKMKQTCLKHFGVENYSQSDESKNRYKNKEFVKHKLEKEYETKKKNNSFGKSKEEKEIYNTLLTKFKEVKTQYKSELYPFPCDFYIPEMDLYIEYQGYFTHGNEPYIGTKEQNELINEWKNKPQKNPQYLRAIDTWTNKDPLKRTIAKQNNLNWIEFFNMKEFTQWFETI